MKKSLSPPISLRKKQLLLLGSAVIAAFLLGGIAGWVIKDSTSTRTGTRADTPCLRSGGYQLISPLLLCDAYPTANSASLAPLQKKLEDILSTSQQKGEITNASVYFRIPGSAEQVNINADEKYFPASLKKVPVMMAYYKKAEADPTILATRGTLQGTQDFNEGVEIPPRHYPVYGNEYSVEELIEMMIKYSDNNSVQMLTANLRDEELRSIYRQLQIESPDDELSITDFITARQFSLFFRILYNATYLSPSYSEKALRLLSQSDFKDGLVAGVPAEVSVAHKFGVLTHTQSNGSTLRELHDCGIIYEENNPYILCVMTKSAGELSKAKEVIAQVSAETYEWVTNNQP